MFLYVCNLGRWLKNAYDLFPNFLIKNETKSLFFLEVIECQTAFFASKDYALWKWVSNKSDFIILLGDIKTVHLLAALLFFFQTFLLRRFDMGNLRTP